MKRLPVHLLCAIGIMLSATSFAMAQTGDGIDLTWNTVDGGGATFSTGGQFTLGGTVGQPDVGVSTGGSYVAIGGFWANMRAGQEEHAIPAVSEWGMITTALLVLTAGTIVFGLRRPAVYCSST